MIIVELEERILKMVEELDKLEPGSEEYLRQSNAIKAVMDTKNGQDKNLIEMEQNDKANELEVVKVKDERANKILDTIVSIGKGLAFAAGSVMIFLFETDGNMPSTSVARDTFQKILKHK